MFGQLQRACFKVQNPTPNTSQMSLGDGAVAPGPGQLQASQQTIQPPLTSPLNPSQQIAPIGPSQRVGSSCVDLNPSCASWAAQGLCSASTVAMSEICARSCNPACSGNVANATTLTAQSGPTPSAVDSGATVESCSDGRTPPNTKGTTINGVKYNIEYKTPTKNSMNDWITYDYTCTSDPPGVPLATGSLAFCSGGRLFPGGCK
jgi:hypothetical protein